LKHTTSTCADGCCTTYGYDVFVDGEKIGFTTGEDATELAELLNEHFELKYNSNAAQNVKYNEVPMEQTNTSI
jgi:hypothetical protein